MRPCLRSILRCNGRMPQALSRSTSSIQRWPAPSFRVGNLIRDRQLLELAKREAAAVMEGPNSEITQVEISRALVALRTRWQHTYGLVEVG